MSTPAANADPRPYRGFVIVVLQYGGAADTIECLSSVRDAGTPLDAVLVVDNASADGAAATVAAAFPHVPLLRLPENLGFSGGNNVAVEFARRAGATHVVLLNNDTTVAAGFLDAFADFFAAHDDVVLLTPRIVWYDDPARIWNAGGSYSAWVGFPRDTTRNRRDGPAFDRARPITAATGCALGVRLDRLPPGDLFVPEFFAYAEDLALTLRVRAAGGSVVYAPVTRVLHKDGRTSARRGGRSLSAWLSARNIVWLARARLRWYHWPTAVVAYLSGYIGRMVAAHAMRGDWSAAAAVCTGTMAAFRTPLPPGLRALMRPATAARYTSP